jgi:predicted ribosomally synthesized peptide with SipW-like signal peptide
VAVTGKSGLTRRRLLGSIVTTGFGSAAAGAGTAAYFSDTESSTGNSISTGTLNLSFRSSNPVGFAGSLTPQKAIEWKVELVNDGTLSGTLTVDFSIQTTGNKKPEKVAEKFEIDTLQYNPDDGRTLTPSNVPENITLWDVADSEPVPDYLTGLGDPGGGTEFIVVFGLKDVNPSFKNEGVVIEITFNLNQNDSQ